MSYSSTTERELVRLGCLVAGSHLLHCLPPSLPLSLALSPSTPPSTSPTFFPSPYHTIATFLLTIARPIDPSTQPPVTTPTTEKAEQDYQDALKAIEDIKISHEEYHRLTWELHQRLNEIADLQKALSDAQTFLFEERKQLLKVMAENDDLRGERMPTPRPDPD